MDSESKNPSASVEIYDIITEKDVSRYCLRVSLESSSGKSVYNLTRRFREFIALDSSLRKMFRSDIIPTLPPKTIFKRFEENFLQERKVSLQRYLDAIMKVPYLQNSPAMWNFLQINQNTEQPIAPTQILTSYPSNLQVEPWRTARSSYDFFHAATSSHQDHFFSASADRSSFGRKNRFGFCTSCIPTYRGVIQVWKQVDTAVFRRKIKELVDEPELKPNLSKWSTRKTSTNSSVWTPRTVNYKEDLDEDSWPRQAKSAGYIADKIKTPLIPSQNIRKATSNGYSGLLENPLGSDSLTPPLALRSAGEEKYSLEMLPPKRHIAPLPKPVYLQPEDTMLTSYYPSCLCYHEDMSQLYVGSAEGAVHRYNLLGIEKVTRAMIGREESSSLRLVASGTLPSPHESVVNAMEIYQDCIFVAGSGLVVSCLSINDFTILTYFKVSSPVRTINVHNGHIFLSFKQDKDIDIGSKLANLPVLVPDLIDDLKEEEKPVVKKRLVRRATSSDNLSSPTMVGHMCINSHSKRLFCADKRVVSVWILEASCARLTNKWKDPTGLIKEITSICVLPEYKAVCLGGDTGYINFFTEDGKCICTYQAATEPIRYLQWVEKTLQIAAMAAHSMSWLSVPPVLFNYHFLPRHQQELTYTSGFFDNVIPSKLMYTGQGLKRHMSEDSLGMLSMGESKFDLRFHNSKLMKSRRSRKALSFGNLRPKEASLSYGVGKHMYTISCITVDTADDLSYYSEEEEVGDESLMNKKQRAMASSEDKERITDLSLDSRSLTSTRNTSPKQ